MAPLAPRLACRSTLAVPRRGADVRNVSSIAKRWMARSWVAAGWGLASLAAAGFSAAVLAPSAQAQQQGYGQTLQDSSSGGASSLGPGVGKSGSILDATNPIDLMNRLRRSQALDEATPPSTAIDQALKEYSTQSATSGASPSAGVKGP